MSISENLRAFFGKPIVNFRPGDAVEALDSRTYRLSIEYDDDETSLINLLEEFLGKADLGRLDALVLGLWHEAYEESIQPALDHLISRSADLPALRALFCAEVTYEDCEISWLKQGDYTPLLAAFPDLEVLRIRGSTDLRLEPFQHGKLKQLAIECGGLPTEIVQAIGASNLPALEWLELWLGSDNYGFDGKLDDYVELLEKSNLDPKRLRYLGLRNAEISDELAQWLATRPWVANLETLDLSLGTLSDEGARALFDSEPARSLQTLNIVDNYVSEEWLNNLSSLPFTLLADPQRKPDRYDDEDDEDTGRYVAVSE